jgi:hypothetical protein
VNPHVNPFAHTVVSAQGSPGPRRVHVWSAPQWVPTQVAVGDEQSPFSKTICWAPKHVPGQQAAPPQAVITQ